ncbi:MAG: 1-(5-phosphoribosyl)-5-[(5-phosphoribosylamino)methylideneamino] imidazole-4-carboxamide isomerase [Gemmatimonadota bacterium]|nr:MAG: 1-(5-phosphoribosyl)-5-[(5-phosphoribosylamino)methylideneamino] imidazole-4-carboxamide isomerase [Gemmatimonadota bacterium]
MRLYPAIDLKGGRVVRWLEGEVTRETVYSDDPLDRARYFIDQGAEWLHVVDMDKAFGTGGSNLDLIHAIAQLDDVSVQVGGNIDSVQWAREAVAAGAKRVVLGTAAALDAGLFQALVREVDPERCALALDTRDGKVALRGLDRSVGQRSEDIVRDARDVGVRTVVYRDLARDGLVIGADVAGAATVQALGVDVIVAGGVAGLYDIESAAQCGLAGVIVGRALYEGRFTLREALACSR